MDIKKGTTTVGIVCKDAVILAADRRATAGHMIVDKRAKKVHEISDNMAVTIAGAVADAQLLIKVAKAETRLKSIRTGKKPNTKEVANMLGGFLYSNVRQFFPGITHFLLGGADRTGLKLFDLFPDGSVTDIEDYVSSGSGSVFAYGVLETHYQKDLLAEDGIRLAVKAINTALQRDSASGNGIDVVKVTTDGVERVVSEKVEARLELK